MTAFVFPTAVIINLDEEDDDNEDFCPPIAKPHTFDKRKMDCYIEELKKLREIQKTEASIIGYQFEDQGEETDTGNFFDEVEDIVMEVEEDFPINNTNNYSSSHQPALTEEANAVTISSSKTTSISNSDIPFQPFNTVRTVLNPAAIKQTSPPTETSHTSATIYGNVRTVLNHSTESHNSKRFLIPLDSRSPSNSPNYAFNSSTASASSSSNYNDLGVSITSPESVTRTSSTHRSSNNLITIVCSEENNSSSASGPITKREKKYRKGGVAAAVLASTFKTTSSGTEASSDSIGKRKYYMISGVAATAGTYTSGPSKQSSSKLNVCALTSRRGYGDDGYNREVCVNGTIGQQSCLKKRNKLSDYQQNSCHKNISFNSRRSNSIVSSNYHNSVSSKTNYFSNIQVKTLAEIRKEKQLRRDNDSELVYKRPRYVR